jgi:transposase
MKAPLYVRPLSPVEQAGLEAGLHSSEAFTLRRCQILLASSRGQRPRLIAQQLGCAVQTVRNAIREFQAEGLTSIKAESSRPKSVMPVFDEEKRQALKALLHQSPRTFGKPTSVWSLHLAAQVCHELDLTERQVSIETIRSALKRLGVSWQRAKRWITSPDRDYVRKKKDEITSWSWPRQTAGV